MPTPCSWCTHPRRGEIERRVADGWSFRQVTETFGGSIPSASRHFRLGHPATRPMTAEQLGQPHGIAIPAQALDQIRRPEVSSGAATTEDVTTPSVTSEPDSSAAVGASRSGSPVRSLREEFAVLVSATDQLAVDNLGGDELDEVQELLSALSALLSPALESSRSQPSGGGAESVQSGSPSGVTDVSERGLDRPNPVAQPTDEEPTVATSDTHNDEQPAPFPELPQTIHFLDSMVVPLSHSTFGDSRAFGYGDELVVTKDVLAANSDRNGDSWLRTWLTGTADGYRRGEREMCRRGSWPEDKCRLLPGSWAWEDARERDNREALAISDPAEREERRRWIRAFYGTAPTTSRTLMTVTRQ